MKDLAMALDLEKDQLKAKISFVNMYLHSLHQLNIPKLSKEVDVQSSVDRWVMNTKSFFDQGSTISFI